MWLTTMWHVGTGLPWDWRLGPSGSSERDHLKQMIAALPAGRAGHRRRGVRRVRVLEGAAGQRPAPADPGRGERAAAEGPGLRQGDGPGWSTSGRTARRRGDQPPLVLRLVVACGGRHPVYLVTSVLDEEQLSDEHVIIIYALRWGVELFYRHFKQTFGRRKLRSHRGDHAEVEATWSLLGLWSLGLHAEVELARQGVPARRVSVAGLLRAYRASMREYRSRPGPGESLWERLSEAVIDEYKRTEQGEPGLPAEETVGTRSAPPKSVPRRRLRSKSLGKSRIIMRHG